MENELMSAMNIDEIMARLPHRYPFLLVDRVLEMQADTFIRAMKNVSINEPHFTGHFPKFPVMPGVLIVEAMAQVGGILAFESAPKDQEFIVYFTGIDGVRFRKPARPGDQLIFELTVLRRRGHMWKFKAEAFIDGDLACSGELMATLMPQDQA